MKREAAPGGKEVNEATKKPVLVSLLGMAAQGNHFVLLALKKWISCFRNRARWVSREAERGNCGDEVAGPHQRSWGLLSPQRSSQHPSLVLSPVLRGGMSHLFLSWS